MKGTLSLEEAEKFARDSLRLLGPIVESYAGEIPVYDIRMKEVYENDNEELHRNLQEIPFSVGADERNFIEFYRQGIENCLTEELRDEKSTEVAVGYWMNSLVHDIFHLCQPEFVNRSEKAHGKEGYEMWTEGSAEFCSFMICLDIYEKSLPMDRTKEKDLDFVLNSMSERKVKEGLESMLGWHCYCYSKVLGQDITRILPVELPEGVKRRMKENAEKYDERMSFKDDEPYAYGFAYFAMNSGKGDKDFRKLLRKPVPNEVIKAAIDRSMRKA